MGKGKTSRVETTVGGAIVKLPTENYRKVAQNHWGLTDKQMKGMHVHHRVPRSQGGTNDPSNLYVCSPWFHANVWHDGNQFVLWASIGGKSSSPRKTNALVENGKRVGKLPNSEKQLEHIKRLGKHNVESGHLKRAQAISHERASKPVLLTHIETGKTIQFESLADAARGLNLNRPDIRRVCQGKRKTTKGYTASYIK